MIKEGRKIGMVILVNRRKRKEARKLIDVIIENVRELLKIYRKDGCKLQMRRVLIFSFK